MKNINIGGRVIEISDDDFNELEQRKILTKIYHDDSWVKEFEDYVMKEYVIKKSYGEHVKN